MPTAVTRQRHINNITILILNVWNHTTSILNNQKCSKTRASTERCDTQKERTRVLDLEARDLHCGTRALWRTRTWHLYIAISPELLIRTTRDLRTEFKPQQELSYRQHIARQLRTQYAEGIYRHTYYIVTLKSRLRVTQGHWKRNHWIDHTRLSSNRVIWRWILLWPWNVG